MRNGSFCMTMVFKISELCQ
ncbi:hypothetical protein Nmel_013537, partial [Mimus melanotis]